MISFSETSSQAVDPGLARDLVAPLLPHPLPPNLHLHRCAQAHHQVPQGSLGCTDVTDV